MNTVRPPCTAVILSSRRPVPAPRDGYDDAAQHMAEPARQQPGFLAVESARNPDGFGITVSSWQTAEHARAWKQVVEHVDAQRRGAREWCADCTVRMADRGAAARRRDRRHRTPPSRSPPHLMNPADDRNPSSPLRPRNRADGASR